MAATLMAIKSQMLLQNKSLKSLMMKIFLKRKTHGSLVASVIGVSEI